ncbi:MULTISPECIES: MurR/RpiR family transcriptional regulator [Peptostreptococcales]|uniref:MurR/RpiR family transcriptional regulator n=1 Tax=Peptostreptococcales TaxID=3082720 RepID=UPI000E4B7F65|nr:MULTISPECIES: MurR/RpiR family transcriptional regulator [Peptostreptococcaceae]MEE0247458.1 MurR/RpiR family transcriptional regulator [Peptacetobacter hiranonis]RHQ97953.1 MurR/RpiR family transcriptional regulator [Peptoclostridium sp. AF21-18]
MSNRQNILDKICMMYDSFFEQEKKVASYIMKNHRQVINMTINDLAKESGTSIATVTRFCKKCDVDGFHHLKISLAKEIVNSDDEIVASKSISEDSFEQSLNNILANKVRELEQTVSLIDTDILKSILDVIKKARIVQFVAVGNTIPVAIDGVYRFNEIGIKTVSSTIWETQLAFSMSLDENDVMIAISNSGESKKVFTMVEEAKSRGVKTIGITNNPNSNIANIVDYHIQTITREKLFLDEFYFSRISAMTIVEILYILLAADNKNSYNMLSACENLMANEKI